MVKLRCRTENVAQLKREVVRVNITIETDEDDLIGGFRLVNGSTVWHNAQSLKLSNEEAIFVTLTKSTLPLTKFSAFRASLREMEFSLRKLADSLDPAKGFNVFATANTKGKGSDDGRFIGTNVLNEKLSLKDSQLPSSNPIPQ